MGDAAKQLGEAREAAARARGKGEGAEAPLTPHLSDEGTIPGVWIFSAGAPGRRRSDPVMVPRSALESQSWESRSGIHHTLSSPSSSTGAKIASLALEGGVGGLGGTCWL